MSVTIPHKQTVMAFLDEIDPAATAIGSVNTIVKRDGRLLGYNTDKDGFLRPLHLAACDPAGLRALVLGVGGTERAVAYGLIEAGVASIALAGRRRERVEAAAAHLESTSPRHVPVTRVPWTQDALATAAAQSDLVVNCTPIGMRHTGEERESPLTASMLRPGLWVYDVVYNPLETELLRLARLAGCTTISGLAMLAYQAAAQQALWTGREPPIDTMLAAATAELTRQD